jgi:hypothetical protein
MTIRQAIADLDDSERREILGFILEGFLTPSFGSMPRKEIELLMLEGLVKARYLDADPTLYQLTQRLKITRARSRNLIYERDLRRLDAAKLDQLLQSVITKPLIQKQGDLFCLEIENPLLTDHIKYRLGQLGHVTDGSFSPSIVKLTLDAFKALVADAIPQQRHASIMDALIAAGATDESFAGLIRGFLKKLGGRFADSAGEELGESISDYLVPLFSGTSSEITSRFSNLFSGTT